VTAGIDAGAVIENSFLGTSRAKISGGSIGVTNSSRPHDLINWSIAPSQRRAAPRSAASRAIAAAADAAIDCCWLTWSSTSQGAFVFQS